MKTVTDNMKNSKNPSRRDAENARDAEMKGEEEEFHTEAQRHGEL
jgi:hypothetical protein